jgi:secreted PhoX family phosphatase
MRREGDYTRGQTFVLRVNAFLSSGGDPAADWNQQAAGVQRTGSARWVKLTNHNGVPGPGITDPFRNGPTNDPRTNEDTRGGRPAADDVGGTPYGRPEDMEVATLANGNEVLYIAVTSENAIYAVEILDSANANVWVAASGATPKNLGHAPTTGSMGSPDNLAQDACGNIYIIEDAPNTSNTGGDIWFMRDVDNDGVAESIDHFLSITVDGSESTGMIFNPKKPTEFVMAVQHPDSTDLANVPDGLGDAVWVFDLSGVPNQEFVQKLNGAVGPPQ